MTSRNESPSRASTSDFARVMPMLVPSPPLSLITATRSRAAAASGDGVRSAARGTSAIGSRSRSARMPDAPSPRAGRRRSRVEQAGGGAGRDLDRVGGRARARREQPEDRPAEAAADHARPGGAGRAETLDGAVRLGHGDLVVVAQA